MNRRSRERSVIPEVLLVFSIIRTLETKHLVLMLIIRSWDRLIFTILFKRTRRTAENDRLRLASVPRLPSPPASRTVAANGACDTTDTH